MIFGKYPNFETNITNHTNIWFKPETSSTADAHATTTPPR